MLEVLVGGGLDDEGGGELLSYVNSGRGFAELEPR